MRVSVHTELDLLRGQMRVLERIARGATLAETLDALIDFIEAQEPGIVCGILLVSDDGAHFRRGAGRRLPAAYHDALDGVPITPPHLGECGEVAHRGVPVIVPDIAADRTYSAEWRDLVLSCGLRALRSTPVIGADGRVLASFAIYYDRPCHAQPAHPHLASIATHLAGIAIERSRAEEKQRLLTQELNHRVKNTLAIVQSLAAQTGRQTHTREAFEEAFSARLTALARAHDVLTHSAWNGAQLEDLVHTCLRPFRNDRRIAMHVAGPRVQLRPDAAIALTLALHELATNAAKYGALSDGGGNIDLTWRIAGNGETGLVLAWTERGGPPVQKPQRRGFGSRLIAGLANQLNATVDLDFDPAGLRFTLTMPLPGVAQERRQAVLTH